MCDGLVNESLDGDDLADADKVVQVLADHFHRVLSSRRRHAVELDSLTGCLERLHLDLQEDRAHLDELLDDVDEVAGLGDQPGRFDEFADSVPFDGLLLILIGGPVVHRRTVGINAPRLVFGEVLRLFQRAEGGRARQFGVLGDDGLDAVAARVVEGRVRLTLRVHGHGDMAVIGAVMMVPLFVVTPGEFWSAHIW